MTWFQFVPQKVLKALNCKGVGYKRPAKGAMSDDVEDIGSTGCRKKTGKNWMDQDDGSTSEDNAVSVGPPLDIDPLAEPEYITPSKTGIDPDADIYKGRTPENPILIENNVPSPASSSDVPLAEIEATIKRLKPAEEEDAVSMMSLRAMCENVYRKGVVGKRQRKIPARYKGSTFEFGNSSSAPRHSGPRKSSQGTGMHY